MPVPILVLILIPFFPLCITCDSIYLYTLPYTGIQHSRYTSHTASHTFEARKKKKEKKEKGRKKSKPRDRL